MLKEMFSFMNNNAGGFQAIFAIAVFLATVFYVLINSFMHREMVKTREREESPIISIRIHREIAATYSLIIENISNVSAYNLHFTKAPDLKHVGTRITTKKLGIIEYPIKYLAPRQMYSTIFLDLNSLKKEFQFKEVEFEIKYEDKNGKEFTLPFYLNISSLHYTLIPIKKGSLI